MIKNIKILQENKPLKQKEEKGIRARNYYTWADAPAYERDHFDREITRFLEIQRHLSRQVNHT